MTGPLARVPSAGDRASLDRRAGAGRQECRGTLRVRGTALSSRSFARPAAGRAHSGHSFPHTVPHMIRAAHTTPCPAGPLVYIEAVCWVRKRPYLAKTDTWPALPAVRPADLLGHSGQRRTSDIVARSNEHHNSNRLFSAYPLPKVLSWYV